MRGAIDISQESFRYFFRNPKLYFIVLLPQVIANFSLFIFSPVFDQYDTQNYTDLQRVPTTLWVIFFISLVVVSFVNIISSLAMVVAIADPSLSPSAAYDRSISCLARSIGIVILSFLLVFVGLIVLIIPGIWIAVSLSFVWVVLIVEDTGVIDSMKRSEQLVNGSWWPVFLRFLFMAVLFLIYIMLTTIIELLIITAPNFIRSFVHVLLSTLLIPFATAFKVVMYRDLCHERQEQAASRSTTLISGEV